MTNIREIIREKKVLAEELKNMNDDDPLFKIRCHYKELILYADLQNLSSYYKYEDAIFLKKYRMMLLTDRIAFPNFIFDEYDKENFEICYEMLKNGISIGEIIHYYKENLKKDYKVKQYV